MLCVGVVSGHRRGGCPMSKRYIVTLTAEERGRLEKLTCSGRTAARKLP